MLKTQIMTIIVTALVVACNSDSDNQAISNPDSGQRSTDTNTSDNQTDTATGTEETLMPIVYDSDQYGNPEAACDPQPEEVVLTAEVTEESAWVGQCANRFGLQGAWFAYTDKEDGGLSTITMDYSAAPTGKICATGTGGKVYYEAYDKYWGAGFGVDICTMGTEDTPVEGTLGDCTLFDSRTNIIGFRITVEGDQIPSGPDGADPQLRVQFAEYERAESTYLIVDGPGTADYLFADAVLKYAIDRGDTDVPPINVGLIKTLQFQVSTTTVEDTPFSFCVSDIMPILE